MDENDDEPEHPSANNTTNSNNNSSSTTRWTCEACGCNTNQESDRSCTICGTSNSGPSLLLRRHGGGASAPYGAAAAAARVGLMARGFAARHPEYAFLAAAAAASGSGGLALEDVAAAAVDDDDDDDGDDEAAMWESVVDHMAFAEQHDAAAAVTAARANEQEDDEDEEDQESSSPFLLSLSLMNNNNSNSHSNSNRNSNRNSRLSSSSRRLMEAARAFSLHNNSQAALDDSSHSSAAAAAAATTTSTSTSSSFPNPATILAAATANASAFRPSWAEPAQLTSAAAAAATAASRRSDSNSSSNSSSSSSSPTRLRQRHPRSGNNNNNQAGDDILVTNHVSRQLAHVPEGAREGRAIRTEMPLPSSSSSSSPFRGLGTTTRSSKQQQQQRIFGFKVAFDHPSCTTPGGNMGGCHLVGVTTTSFSSYAATNGLAQSPYFWGIEDGGQRYEGSSSSSSSRAGRSSSHLHLHHHHHHSSNNNSNVGNRRSLLFGSSGSSGSGIPRSSSLRIPGGESSSSSSSMLFGHHQVVTVVCDLDHRTMTFWRDDVLLGTLVTNLPRRGHHLYPIAVPFNSGVTVAITGMDQDPLPLLEAHAAERTVKKQEAENSLRNDLLAKRAHLIETDGKPTKKLHKVLEEIFALYREDSDDYHDDDAISYTMACRLWYRCGLRLSTLNSILTEENRQRIVLDDFIQVVTKVLESDILSQTTTAASACNVGDMVELVDEYDKYGDASGGPMQPGDRGTVVELQRGPNGERRSIRVLYNGRRWWYQPQAVVSERSGLIESPAVWFLNGVISSHGFDCETLESLFSKKGETDWLLHRNALFPLEEETKTADVENEEPAPSLKSPAASAGDKLMGEIAAVSRLEQSAVDVIQKECKRSSDALASLFSAGLPEAVVSAIELATKQMNSLEPREDLLDKVTAIASLVTTVVEKLYSDSVDEDNDSLASEVDQQVIPRIGRPDGSSSFGINDDPPFSFGSSLSSRREDCSTAPLLKGALDSMLRCRGESSEAVGDSLRQGGPSFFTFVRQLIAKGILVDSKETSRSLIDSYQRKKGHLTALHRASCQLLRHAVDEEGTPILRLAISFGCRPDLIALLILYGCPVGPDDLKKAIDTDQPRTLAVLLKFSSCRMRSFPLDGHSEEIKQVLEQAKTRQNELDKQMRDAAGAFVASVVKKLTSLGLKSRQNHSAQSKLCSKVICSTLVGDVLLLALEKAQKASCTSDVGLSETIPPDRSARILMNESDSAVGSNGVLCCLPKHVMKDAVFGDDESATCFFLLIEDFLCSRDMSDAAAGLTMLSIVLTLFPQLRGCPLVARYGFVELVSFHDSLVSNKIAELLSKEFKAGLDVSTKSDSSRSDQSSALLKHDSSGEVLCPKKHVAVLHITRHSSFRCDICGCAIERGRPMHGCRECDWDACEDCTDKSESGLIKCAAIRELAGKCLGFLSEHQEEADFMDDESEIENLTILSRNDTTAVLNDIAIRLLRHDDKALRDLGILLQDPGRITFHQFLSIALPAIHASLTGKSAETDDAGFGASSGHKKKKARVAGCSASLLSPDALFEFGRKSVRTLLSESDSSENSREDSPSEAKLDMEVEVSDSLGCIGALGSSSTRKESQWEISYSNLASEILRRIHQVLSLYESVMVNSVGKRFATGSDRTGELHFLKKPLDIKLEQYSLGTVRASSPPRRLSLTVEPLVPMSEVELHVLRSCRVEDQMYTNYCRSLAIESAIILERPLKSKAASWQIAKVMKYVQETGSHIVQYACRIKLTGSTGCVARIEDDSSLSFTGPTQNLILAARDYVVIYRCNDTKLRRAGRSPSSRAHKACEDITSNFANVVGQRVECDAENDGVWKVYTLVGFEGSSRGAVVVSDEGVVFTGIPAERIRSDLEVKSEGSRAGARKDARRIRRLAEGRNPLGRAFPFLSASRQGADESTPDAPGSLTRSWSALALSTSMRPIDITFAAAKEYEPTCEPPVDPVWNCRIGSDDLHVTCPAASVELPPKLCVKFSTSDKLPPLSLPSSSDSTLANVLTALHRDQAKWREWPSGANCKLFFTLEVDPQSSAFLDRVATSSAKAYRGEEISSNGGGSYLLELTTGDRSRKLSARSLSDEEEEKVESLCEGIDETCVLCMEIIDVFSKHADNSLETSEPEKPVLPGFSNFSLSKKLTDQLEDPLCVVSGTLPLWCTTAPAFSPRIFSYKSRQTLLQRAAFGISRSTLRQQESKVNVGRLRQRMASLRARAVELMGEAFSGGAEDPTALQLQADELYGMEEALAARVRAAFRAAKWQEHSLQVAKAAVRRDNLLADAASIMDHYATDEKVNRRRLEVRFEKESGFDAASGDEAGVTRGFYADVAEALLSTETVAGVNCSSSCAKLSSIDSSPAASKPMDIDGDKGETKQLPLWIPDMDTSAQVVIPTPRADDRSSPGVYPRPLPCYHPQLDNVLRQFRFMGRLFAAAMRDGFMFTLPLSASFLKLVQHAPDQVNPHCKNSSSFNDLVLTAADLPRPGFVGGEIYAAYYHICRTLDAADAEDPPLSRVELDRRYNDIGSDKNFARIAFGMSYDCSFNEYFQDRTFVDPLDPAQDDEAAPLCTRGHKKSVTIYNVREWVALAKKFVLFDGVIAQAVAFRHGVKDFFSPKFLCVFTCQELQRDVCGTGDDVDKWDESAIRKLFKLNGGKGAAEALVAVAAIGGEGGAALSRRFGPASPTIAFLVKALLEATAKQRRQFLSFVTSVPIVTPGRIEVVPIVSPSGDFLPLQDPTCLPRANTCARRLYLPKFETYESFRHVFWAVVQEESRFKGFYEWRGGN